MLGFRVEGVGSEDVASGTLSLIGATAVNNGDDGRRLQRRLAI